MLGDSARHIDGVQHDARRRESRWRWRRRRSDEAPRRSIGKPPSSVERIRREEPSVNDQWSSVGVRGAHKDQCVSSDPKMSRGSDDHGADPRHRILAFHASTVGLPPRSPGDHEDARGGVRSALTLCLLISPGKRRTFDADEPVLLIRRITTESGVDAGMRTGGILAACLS